MIHDIFIVQLQKVNDEQKNKIHKTERALKVAEVSKFYEISHHAY